MSTDPRKITGHLTGEDPKLQEHVVRFAGLPGVMGFLVGWF
jgi:hypothetical protein